MNLSFLVFGLTSVIGNIVYYIVIMIKETQKICIGTANFGLAYGLSNKYQQLQFSEVNRIIKLAKTVGITTVDSAFNYGSSHTVLKKFDLSKFELVTKIKICNNFNPKDVIKDLEQIGQYKTITLLIHNAYELNLETLKRILYELQSLKDQKFIDKIGLSIYEPEILEPLEDLDLYDSVQFPLNVFDQRIIDTGWLQKLKGSGVELVARSIFFQGVLLMPIHSLPNYFKRWRHLFERWINFLNETKQSPYETAVEFINSVKELDKIVVGLDTATQLRQLISKKENKKYKRFDANNFRDPNLLNPYLWDFR